jgi:hypothetical protein
MFHNLGFLGAPLLLAASVSAAAAPYARPAPLAPNVPPEVAANQAKMIPDAADVSLPAYPGSYFISSMGPAKHPFAVVLASDDPPAKVQAWYAAHLKGMQYYPELHAFAPPGSAHGSGLDILDKPHVMIRPMKPGGLMMSLARLPNVKTRINVDFHPGGSR